MLDADLFPRFALGHWPTPLEPCRRLDVGIDVWLKRDDCSGLAFGGNKTRKLEFLIGRALAEGAERVVTFGAVQSNHARQTAAACAAAGLECDLILTRVVSRDDDAFLRSGNVLLDGVLGANVHVVTDGDAAAAKWGELVSDHEGVFTIVPGGSDATGTLGYVNAAAEIASQCAELGVSFDRIVVATSTGGTAAGLILGTTLAGIDAIVDVACVYEPEARTREVICGLLEVTAGLVGAPIPGEDRWTVTDATIGDGYGIPSDEGLAAIDLVAKTEGVLLDPVYTSKAFALMLRDERYRGRRVLFMHTGGAPALFAYDR